MADPDQFFDDSEHFFLRFLNKKLRTLNKKLREIEQLEFSGVALKPEQKQKILSKSKFLEEKTHFESMKVCFYQAEKEFPPSHNSKPASVKGDDDKVMVTKKDTTTETNDIKTETKETITAEPNEITKDGTKNIIERNEMHSQRQTIKTIFDLIHLAQIWLQCNFSQSPQNLKNHQTIMNDLNVLAEFYHKVFFIPPDAEYLSPQEKNARYVELEKFLLQNKDNVISNMNYGKLHDIVTKYDDLNRVLKQGNATEETKEELLHDVKEKEEHHTPKNELKPVESIPKQDQSETKTSKQETPRINEEEHKENIIIQNNENLTPQANELITQNKETTIIENETKNQTEEKQLKDDSKGKEKEYKQGEDGFKRVDRENKRNYQADARGKYQLAGEKKGFNGYNKFYDKNKKVGKMEYVVEYVKKE